MEASVELAGLLAQIQANTVIVVGLMFVAAAIGTAFGFAILGSKFLECAARQPELAGMLQVRMFIIAGLLDALSIISVAFAALLLFANPLLGPVQAALGG